MIVEEYTNNTENGPSIQPSTNDAELKKSQEENFDDEIIPDADRVIFGLRDTGYDLNTAIADIVDNSITAEATRVDISINLTPKQEIIVYICDNGHGMNQNELRNAMKYGSAEHSDKKSLSKFGLGLKTASTAFCKCLSLISRGSDGVIRKIQWDLDYVAQQNKWKPKTMEPSKEEIKILDGIAGSGTGTMVKWEKVDRLLNKGISDYSGRNSISNAIKSRKSKLRYHLGVTFQRFLDKSFVDVPDIEISIDMVPVDPIDPFCKAEPETVIYPLPKPLMVMVDDNEKHPLNLTAYVLPRQSDFTTPEARDTANISVSGEGFYIYRENRLIHYGDWMGMFQNEPHYSLLRVQFDFGAELDSAFNVDIKKSRILPADEIITWIKESFIAAPRREANERYRTGKTKQISKDSANKDAHASSNKTLDQQAPFAEESKMTPQGDDKAFLQNSQGSFLHKIEIVSEPKESALRVIPVDSLDDGNLWKPCLTNDGKHAVKINKSHPFYQKVYYPILGQSVMVTGIDALLWALAEAENSVVNEMTEEYYEDMRAAVSRQLKKIIQNLPDPELDIDVE